MIRRTTTTAAAGVGAYPSDPYFDPSRPSWLPFWLDTPGENAQKWGLFPDADVNTVYPAPSMPVPPPVPAGALDDITVQNPASAAAAQAVIDRQIADQVARQNTQTADFMARVTGMLDDAAAQRDAASAELMNVIKWTAVAAAGVFVLSTLKGRR